MQYSLAYASQIETTVLSPKGVKDNMHMLSA